MRALTETGYTIPTPIQAQAIPPLLEGRDLLGLAETGSGKTAAFALPLLQRLSADGSGRPAPRCTRALILAPTRELAIQIGESIGVYGRGLNLRHTVIFGGVGQRPQVKAVERGVDIVVATPGRLLDLIDQRCLRLEQVGILVLDEADRMFDMGFIRDVRKIVRMVPKVRQTLLFSATMPHDIAALAGEVLHNPVRIEIARAGKTVDRVEQRVHFVDAAKKRDLLNTLLADPAMARVIVFTRTKRGADRVAKNLEQARISSHAIHGNKSQGARQAALENFKKGSIRVLVATDIAARGIDIDDITHVVNYELPNIPESYVHRIGRTARAGAAGVAIAFCAPDERAYLRDIERLTRTPIKVEGAVALTAGAYDPAAAKTGDDTTFVPNDGPTFHQQKRERQREQGDRTKTRATRPHDAARGRDGARPSTGRPDRAPRADGDRSRPERPWSNGPGQADRTQRADRGDRGDRGPRGDRPHAAARGADRPGEGRDRGASRARKPEADRPRYDTRRPAPAAGAREPSRAHQPPRDGAPAPRRDATARDGARPAPRHDGPRTADARTAGPRPERRDGDRPFQSRGYKDGGARRPEDSRARGFRDRPEAGTRRPDGDRAPRPGPSGEQRGEHRGPDRKPASARPHAPRTGDAPAHAGRAADTRAHTGERPRTEAERPARRDDQRRGPPVNRDTKAGERPRWQARKPGSDQRQGGGERG